MKLKSLFITVYIVVFAVLLQIPSVCSSLIPQGNLAVESVPSGADVYIDDVLTGKTPFTRKDMKTGKYNIRVHYKGKSKSQTVDILDKQTTKVTFLFSDEYKIGFILTDPLLQSSMADRGYKVIVFDMESSDYVKFVNIPEDKLRSLGVKGVGSAYGLNGFLEMKYVRINGATKRNVTISLGAVLFDYKLNQYIYGDEFKMSKDFPVNPGPMDLNPLRLQTYEDFREDFSRYVENEIVPFMKQQIETPLVEKIPIMSQEDEGFSMSSPDYSSSPFYHLYNRKAPDFKLKDRKDEYIRLSDYIGKRPVLLYFWDASFDFCKEEMDRINEMYRDNPSLFIPIAVSVAGEGKGRRLAESFLMSRIFNFPVVFDTQAVATRYFTKDVVPLTVIIDRQGLIRYMKRGTSDWSLVRQRLELIGKENP